MLQFYLQYVLQDCRVPLFCYNMYYKTAMCFSSIYNTYYKTAMCCCSIYNMYCKTAVCFILFTIRTTRLPCAAVLFTIHTARLQCAAVVFLQNVLQDCRVPQFYFSIVSIVFHSIKLTTTLKMLTTGIVEIKQKPAFNMKRSCNIHQSFLK